MNDIAYTVEDCLEILTGFKNTAYRFSIDPKDNILASIARQVYKGTPLTDRQYQLVKQKIMTYNLQFQECGFNGLEAAVDNLRMPLREINRSKTITTVDSLPEWPNETASKSRYIKIRFPFNKKTIAALERVAEQNRRDYFHRKGSYEHFFNLKESIVEQIVTEFKDRNFEIDQELLEFYKKIQDIKQNPSKHLRCISNRETHKLENIDLDCSIEQLIDRHRRYGIVNFDTYPAEGLLGEIVNRESTEFLGKPSQYSVQQLVETVYHLDRFPLVVVLEERNAEEQIYEFWQETKNIIPSEQQSVLFRLDGDSDFNRFVKDKNLNNWVDNNTKIVYINTNKLPKVTLTADWNPITAFVYGSTLNRFVDTYIKDKCDLVIYREEEMSPMRRYSSYYR